MADKFDSFYPITNVLAESIPEDCISWTKKRNYIIQARTTAIHARFGVIPEITHLLSIFKKSGQSDQTFSLTELFKKRCSYFGETFL